MDSQNAVCEEREENDRKTPDGSTEASDAPTPGKSDGDGKLEVLKESHVLGNGDHREVSESDVHIKKYQPERKGSKESESLIQSMLLSSDDTCDDENQRISSVLKWSDSLRKEFEALQTIDPATDARLSDTGEITLTNDPKNHHVTSKLLRSLISKIPTECESLPIKRQLTKESLDGHIEDQQSLNSCLIRYHRHVKQEPAYDFCWIHRHLIIILARGDETCTSCDSRLEWVNAVAEEETTTTTWYHTNTYDPSSEEILRVEANDREIPEIPRNVYKKMELRKIRSVCVPLLGSETSLIKRFIEYFSRKARKGRIVDRLFLELNISTEPITDDELFINAKNTIEKSIDKKMFLPVRLSGFHISEFCHDGMSPIAVDLETEDIEAVANKVDVFVNSSSRHLEMNKGLLSNKILKLGGQTIQAECNEKKKKGKFSYGDICKTSSGKLSFRKIYHVALYEEWIPTCKLSLQILASLMVHCLKEMEGEDYTSIVFPVLGTGKLGYPYIQVIKTMFNVVRAYGKEKPDTKIERVYFIVYDKDVYCRTAFDHVVEIQKRYWKLTADDFMGKPYKESRGFRKNLIVQIWPEKALLGTQSVRSVEASFIFLPGMGDDTKDRNPDDYYGYIITMLNTDSEGGWIEKKSMVEEKVQSHRFTSVLVDIKGLPVQDSEKYQTVVDMFKDLHCVQSLQIVVSDEVFHKVNPGYAFKKMEHHISTIDFCVWGENGKEVVEEFKKFMQE